MRNKRIKILLSALLISVSMLGISPMYANASEWKQDLKGWWLSEENSYPRSSWRIVNDKWYYFGDDGYMKHDCHVDGYYLGYDGAWVEHSLGSNQSTTESKPQTSTGKNDGWGNRFGGNQLESGKDDTNGTTEYDKNFADMMYNVNK